MSIANIIPVCKLLDILDRSKVKQTMFVASDANRTKEALVYAEDGYNNSDRVRSNFARKNNISFNDARCCKLKNYKD
jgi:hypothetical protein